MLVICLEGCHGSGKTALCEAFRKGGATVLDEGFLDMPDYALHPQSLLMETTWVCSWFERLLRQANQLRQHGNEILSTAVFVADRSPFSAVFYGRNGHLLEPVVREHIKEVAAEAGIHICTVHVKVQPDILWKRILQRLEREPHRLRYNEDKHEWMEKTLAFYDSFQWDLAIENNETSIQDVTVQCCEAVAREAPLYSAALAKSVDILSGTSIQESTDQDMCLSMCNIRESPAEEPCSPAVSPCIENQTNSASSDVKTDMVRKSLMTEFEASIKQSV